MISGAHHAKSYTLCERRFCLLGEILLISEFLVFTCNGASHFSLLHFHISSCSTAIPPIPSRLLPGHHILGFSGLVQMYLANAIARRDAHAWREGGSQGCL
ncbi:uncharacterized protein BDW70DRAFT_133949 [Aspergillus foveolatus]|uniref:uncharacterized protein n=1 Tax=Aspergillus foveolatus TaxID=210207 RepID=UPI003CCCBB61